MDHGFLRLNKVHIPRRQMLMRFARIEKDGSYVKAKVASDKLAYLGMVKTNIHKEMNKQTNKQI
jgi:acyl-CoA oxidase